MRVCLIPCLLISLVACSNQPEVVTRTEFVEIEVCEGEFEPVDGELTKRVPKQVIPQGITWKELIDLLLRDRASLEAVNGKLETIENLHGKGQ